MPGLHRLTLLSRRQAVVWACLWALLAGQALALWHAQAHSPGARALALAGAPASAEQGAFGHERGADCSLLDHLLGLADGPAPAPWPGAAPLPAFRLVLARAQCTPLPLAAFVARAPPRG